jgi:hypothetical protein
MKDDSGNHLCEETRPLSRSKEKDLMTSKLSVGGCERNFHNDRVSEIVLQLEPPLLQPHTRSSQYADNGRTVRQAQCLLPRSSMNDPP